MNYRYKIIELSIIWIILIILIYNIFQLKIENTWKPSFNNL